MTFFRTAWLAASALALTTKAQQTNSTYEYIIVGSGPGGAPLAANLARAGHSVLLLEAGDDQGSNPNISQILNFNLAGNDPSTRWDFFVKHSNDNDRERKFEHLTWRKKDGSFYVGTDPPADAQQLGIYYPRAGTLGGCAMHNAGVVALPSDADWDYISKITGDPDWGWLRMREYLMLIEDAAYVPGDRLHGHGGYLTLTQAQVNTANGSDGKAMVDAMAAELGMVGVTADELVKRDMNGTPQGRDQQTGIFGQLRHANTSGHRVGTNTYIKSTLEDKRKYPLTVQLNSLVSKVLFANQTRGMATTPKAIGVEYLYGKSLYSADPRSSKDNKGEVRQVFATREVIISAGVFNTPQILKLSGIGPKEELDRFGIPVVVDSPGVGTRMADNYETSLISLASRDLGPVGGTTAVMLKSSLAKQDRDLYLFCGGFSFEGYWPGFPTNHGKAQYECAVVHMGPRSQAGTVNLRSADPRDTPDINFRFFETGAEEDLTAILDGVKWARKVFNRAPGGLTPWKELHPCKAPKTNCTDTEQKEWIKNNAYSHHATSSAQIGGDGDKMAVLDGKFRVRGVRGLRVVDASAFPKVPGAFPVLPTFMLSEKATESILEELGQARLKKKVTKRE